MVNNEIRMNNVNYYMNLWLTWMQRKVYRVIIWFLNNDTIPSAGWICFQLSSNCLSAVFQLSFNCLPTVFQLSFNCLSAVFQLSFSCLSTVFQLSFSCLSAVFQLSFNCLSAVFQLSFSCLSTVFQLSFSCLSTVFQLSFSCLSTVFQLSFSCLSAVFQLSFNCLSTVFQLSFSCLSAVFQLSYVFQQVLQKREENSSPPTWHIKVYPAFLGATEGMFKLAVVCGPSHDELITVLLSTAPGGDGIIHDTDRISSSTRVRSQT